MTELKDLFQLTWANEIERSWLVQKLRSMKRQTMNIRLMAGAKFILLKSEEGRIIGWGGLDHSFSDQCPEFFSLHLDPEFRKYGLGVLIELARVTYLLENQIPFAYVRMNRDAEGAELIEKRLSSKFYSVISSENLSHHYVGLCEQCELFQKECQRRVFLKFDVEKFHRQSASEIGVIEGGLPKWFRLIRVAEEQKQAIGGEREPVQIWRSYRPLWLRI